MSYYTYLISREIESKGYDFYALVMALMRRADSDNAEKLQEMFPAQWEELRKRYSSPGGFVSYEEAKQYGSADVVKYVTSHKDQLVFPDKGFPYG